MVSRAAWGEFGFSWLRKTTVKTHKMRAYAVGVVLCRVLAFLWLTRDAREPRRARLQDLGYPPPMVLSIEVTAWEACAQSALCSQIIPGNWPAEPSSTARAT